MLNMLRGQRKENNSLPTGSETMTNQVPVKYQNCLQ